MYFETVTASAMALPAPPCHYSQSLAGQSLFTPKNMTSTSSCTSMPFLLMEIWSFTPLCGQHPHHLGLLQDDHCRFCGYIYESTLHLLLECPGTAAYRAMHGISVHTLFSETPDNIIAIARFDSWIRYVLPMPIRLPTNVALSSITQQAFIAKNKRKAGSTPDKAPSMSKCSKPSEGRTLIMTHPGQLNLLTLKRPYASVQAVSSKRARTTCSRALHSVVL